MSEIKVNSSVVDEERHRAVLDESQILDLVANAVARSAGVSLEGAGVSVRTLHIGSRTSGSISVSKAEAVCEIVVDRRLQALDGAA
ncbi:hypothetical protein [Cupriavidus campinensis]|uniref:Uncharacterized protein n=1 Tax=Cupriavidus campinensis TaxID=151783 RepID=A0AAE9HVP2_9BURK|nr:hypothetical protein [Cupriavidus campinensis]URF02808.1 hypothetical protein M5D45_09505 [Cupriavidus campinensis]